MNQEHITYGIGEAGFGDPELVHLDLAQAIRIARLYGNDVAVNQ